MNYTTEEILGMIEQSRQQLDTENPRELSTRSREQLNNKKIKKQNNVSRLSEETISLTSSLLSETPLKPQEAFVSEIAPASSYTRAITGINAQHSRTDRGVKIMLTMQTAHDRAECGQIHLTAELKRYSRLRELKTYRGDSFEFDEHYRNTIQMIKDLGPEAGGSFCVGRLHQRGKRDAWVADMMVVAKVIDDQIQQVLFYYQTEEYAIDMDADMTAQQQQIYHSAGRYGEINTRKPIPTLATLKRTYQ
jgi:hypothetical protein